MILQRYEWQPAVIGGLFLDDIDDEGIMWLYDEIVAEDKRRKNKTRK